MQGDTRLFMVYNRVELYLYGASIHRRTESNCPRGHYSLSMPPPYPMLKGRESAVTARPQDSRKLEIQSGGNVWLADSG